MTLTVLNHLDRPLRALVAAAFLAPAVGPAAAAAQDRIPSHCVALSALPEARVIPATWSAPMAGRAW